MNAKAMHVPQLHISIDPIERDDLIGAIEALERSHQLCRKELGTAEYNAGYSPAMQQKLDEFKTLLKRWDV